MAKKAFEVLSEPMFYVLMSFLKQDRCGTEIVEFVQQKTKKRVNIGPGTLYAILAKFQDEGLISETLVEGRKRTYRITTKGRNVYTEEVNRLRCCLADAQTEEL
ncbi:MAG: PadR family transcriptional regulator [Massiliimalia sp.]